MVGTGEQGTPPTPPSRRRLSLRTRVHLLRPDARSFPHPVRLLRLGVQRVQRFGTHCTVNADLKLGRLREIACFFFARSPN